MVPINRKTWLAILGTLAILVAISVTAAFYINGAKIRSLDKKRVNDILTLSWRLNTYYYLYGRLPTKLSGLLEMDSLAIPDDPKNGDKYIYKVINKSTFMLCASFSLPSENFSSVGNRIRYGDPIVHGYGSWVHDRGTQCINRTIIALPGLKRPPDRATKHGWRI